MPGCRWKPPWEPWHRGRMQTTDEAPGIYLVKAIIPDLQVMGEPASAFFVAATGSAAAAIEAVRRAAPPEWPLEISENRLSLATVRRLGLRQGEVRLL